MAGRFLQCSFAHGQKPKKPAPSSLWASARGTSPPLRVISMFAFLPAGFFGLLYPTGAPFRTRTARHGRTGSGSRAGPHTDRGCRRFPGTYPGFIHLQGPRDTAFGAAPALRSRRSAAGPAGTHRRREGPGCGGKQSLAVPGRGAGLFRSRRTDVDAL